MSDGGLLTALAESCIGGELGARIELKEVSEEPVRKSLRVFTGEEIYFGELNAL
ncbi:hypothetical protein IIC68_03030 [archaeon]|nr:hypothetical protein [archaeon]